MIPLNRKPTRDRNEFPLLGIFAIALLGGSLCHISARAQSPPGATPSAGNASESEQPSTGRAETSKSNTAKLPESDNKKPREKDRRRSSGTSTRGFGGGLGPGPTGGFGGDLSGGFGAFGSGGMMGTMAGGGGPGDTASLLERALRYSPDVQLAEAKLRTAEVELNRARLEVAKSVIGLEHSIASQQRIIDLDRIRVQRAREAHKRAEEVVKKGVATAAEGSAAVLALKEAESELISAEAKLSELRETLRYMMGGGPGLFPPGMSSGGSGAGVGSMPGGAPMTGAGGTESRPPGGTRSTPPPATSAPPAGSSGPPLRGGAGSATAGWTIKLPAEAGDAAQNSLRRKLQSPTQVQVKEVEPKDLARYLSDLHGVAIMLEPNAAAVGPTISIDIRDVPLHAALQAIEDTNPQIRFYVRDYGILIHNPDVIPDNALTVRDYMQRKGDPQFTYPYGIGVPVEYAPVEAGTSPKGAKPEKSEKRQTRVFKLQHASPREAAEILQKTVGGQSPGALQISPDERTRALVVAGDENDLKQVEALLSNLDVPSNKSEKPSPKK